MINAETSRPKKEISDLSKEEYLARYGHAFPPASPRAFFIPGYKDGRKEPKAGDRAFLRADGFHLRKAKTIAEKQAQYLKEKGQLKIALHHATTNPEACHPGIRSLARMLAFAGKVQVTQNALLFINGWVNNKVPYDFKKLQANKPAQARSLLNVVKTGEGICDDVARLKLFILEELIERKKIDLKPSDVRWLGEEEHKEGTTNTTHAAVGVRAKDGQVWILNNQYKVMAGGDKDKPVKLSTITWAQADELICFASYIQIVSAHLGINGFSAFSSGRGDAIPRCSFNSLRASYFQPGIPQKKSDSENLLPDCYGVTLDSFKRGTSLSVFPRLLQEIVSPAYTISQSAESLLSGMLLGLDVEIKLVPKKKPPDPAASSAQASTAAASVKPMAESVRPAAEASQTTQSPAP